MARSKITKKLSPSGSLIRRVLVIIILFLVIPLFLQSFFLYRQEYEQKLRDVKEDLQLLVDERAFFLKEMVQMDWEFLEQSRGVFENWARLNIERIPLPQGALNRFVAISRSKQAFFAGIAETNTCALVKPIPFSLVAKDMPRPYPIQIALVSKDGLILWQNISLKGNDKIEVEAPIGATGVTLRLNVDKDQIKELHLQSYYLRFASLVFFVGVLGGGAVFLFTKRMAKPLRNLCKAMERVREGGAHVRYTPDWMGFEINKLGLMFNETLDGLLKAVEEAENERLQRAKLAKELSIGHEIQASLLPKHILGLPGVDIATAYYSSKEVNGDFYDLFKLPDGRLLIAICDTAGKGISACLFALGLRSIIRTLASIETDLSQIVRQANDLYSIDAHPSSMFATLWIGIYESKNKTLTYCSQGHPPALLVRSMQLDELWTEGIALGAQKMDVIPTKKVHMEKEDLLVLYTDGITEAHNLKSELFGKNRFYEVLMHKQKSSAQQIADRIIEEVHLFAHGAAQHDDMTLVVMRIQE